MAPRLRRALGVGFCIVLPGIGVAQVGIYKGIQTSVRHLQTIQLLPQDQPNPLATKGMPPPPPKTPYEGKLPPPPNPLQQFKIDHAGKSSVNGENVSATDGLEFHYKGYHIFADAGEGNTRTHIFTMMGHVQVISADSVIKGDKITVDLDRETYHAFDAQTQLSPKAVGGNLKGDLYVKGHESLGTQSETRTYDGDLTTCDLDHPHYSIDGEDVTVRPGRRAIFRKAKIRLFGRTILKVPFLSIPLDDRTYNNLPVVGQSQDEGYYIKSNFTIPLKGRSELQTRLDYMSKRGLGTGATYAYQTRAMNGYIRFYKISGITDTLTFSNEHRQQFSWGVLTVNTDYQQGNYLSAPDSTQIQNRVNLVLPSRGGGSMRLGYSRSSSSTLGNSTTTQTVTVNDDRQIGRNTRTTVDLTYSTSDQQFASATSSSSRQQLDVDFKAQQRLKPGDASFEYLRSIPIGENTNFFGGSDRTPVISFDSDSRRLMGQKFDKAFPFKTQLSVGEFQDYTGDSHISRANFDFSFNKPGSNTRRLRLDYNGEFRQGLYSDGTAQYVLNYGSTLSYRLGRDTSANLRYAYLRPYGYSPLQLDRSGNTNLTSLDVSYRPVRSVLTGLQTGYDITRLQTQDIPWQQVGLRSEWQPTKKFLLRALSTYDTFNQEWSSVRLDSTLLPGRGATLSAGARYDGVRKVWSNANLYLNNIRYGKSTLGVVLTYNGYTEHFDFMQYNVVYDLHCAEAVLTYSENNSGFRAGREVQFFIRLKAFPFDNFFGTGTRGQPLGTGTGRDF